MHVRPPATLRGCPGAWAHHASRGIWIIVWLMFILVVEHAGCLRAEGCSFQKPKGLCQPHKDVPGWGNLRRQDICRLDFENRGSDYFHRLRQLAHDGLTLIAQGFGSCLAASRSPAADGPSCKASIWALVPQIGDCNVPFLTISEVGPPSSSYHHPQLV